MTFKQWLPYIFQALVLMGAAYTYTSSQEHRLTVIEEGLKAQGQALLVLSKTQEIINLQVYDIQKTQARLVALEEFIHKRR